MLGIITLAKSLLPEPCALERRMAPYTTAFLLVVSLLASVRAQTCGFESNPAVVATCFDGGILGTSSVVPTATQAGQGLTGGSGTYRLTSAQEWVLQSSAQQPTGMACYFGGSPPFGSTCCTFDFAGGSAWRWAQGFGTGNWVTLYGTGGGLPTNANPVLLIPAPGWSRIVGVWSNGSTFVFNGNSWALKALNYPGGPVCWDHYLNKLFCVAPSGVYSLDQSSAMWSIEWGGIGFVPATARLVSCSHYWPPSGVTWPGGAVPQLLLPNTTIGQPAWCWDSVSGWQQRPMSGATLHNAGNSFACSVDCRSFLSHTLGSVGMAVRFGVSSFPQGPPFIDPLFCTLSGSFTPLLSGPGSASYPVFSPLHSSFVVVNRTDGQLFQYYPVADSYSPLPPATVSGFAWGLFGNRLVRAPNGQLIAWSGNEARRYDVTTNTWHQFVIPASGMIMDMAYDETGSRLLVGDSGGVILTWDGSAWGLLSPAIPWTLLSYRLVCESSGWLSPIKIVSDNGFMGWITQIGGAAQWVGTDTASLALSGQMQLGLPGVTGVVTDVVTGEMHASTTMGIYTLSRADNPWPGVWVQRSLDLGGVPAAAIGDGWVLGGTYADGRVRWRWADKCAAAGEVQGAGCSQTTAVAGLPPWIGVPFNLDYWSVAPWGIIVMGFSDRQYSGLALPLDLSIIDMKTTQGPCRLYNSMDFSQVVLPMHGLLNLQIVLPNTMAINGIEFGCQIVTPEPGVNPAGLAISDAMRYRVGWR